MRRINSHVLPLLGGSVIALAACHTDKLNGPDNSSAPGSRATHAIDPSVDIALVRASLGDAIERLAPSLSQPDVSRVAAAIRGLSAALDADDANALRHALANTRATLGAANQSPTGTAISLTLDRIEGLIPTK